MLLVLSLDANKDGESCFPSTRRLKKRTGLSRRAVEGHLREAERLGWIRRAPAGKGRGWRRMRYSFHLADVEQEIPHEGAERGARRSPRENAKVEQEVPHVEGSDVENVVPRGGEPGAPKVGNDVPLTLQLTSPETSPVPLRGARKRASEGASSGWVQRAAQLWTDAFGGTAPHGRLGKALKPLIDEHGETEVLEMWARYLATQPAEYANPQDFASKYGHWRNGSSRSGAPKSIDVDDVRAWGDRPRPDIASGQGEHVVE